ncbi:MAG: ATP-binding cassette domain-containing protein, partial [Lachnospiraceae bacterium]|nr:ATP-binding cassette domain-containing protein [Lachnospiraceae bacterium]
MAQIICENVTLGYERDVVVSDLSFSVEAGDYLCIVGENGSGKSTLMKALLGLLQPVSGTVRTGDGLRHNDV